MAFINEYVTEEDIRKYGLDEMWDRTHPRQPWRGVHRHSWTIDRSRNIYLMFLRSGNEMETANDFEFLFWWDGSVIFLHMKRDGDANFRTEEGYAKWHLRRVSIPPDFAIEAADEVKEVLMEALAMYGFNGAGLQLKNYEVTFAPDFLSAKVDHYFQP